MVSLPWLWNQEHGSGLQVRWDARADPGPQAQAEAARPRSWLANRPCGKSWGITTCRWDNRGSHPCWGGSVRAIGPPHTLLIAEGNSSEDAEGAGACIAETPRNNGRIRHF